MGGAARRHAKQSKPEQVVASTTTTSLKTTSQAKKLRPLNGTRSKHHFNICNIKTLLKARRSIFNVNLKSYQFVLYCSVWMFFLDPSFQLNKLLRLDMAF